MRAWRFWRDRLHAIYDSLTLPSYFGLGEHQFVRFRMYCELRKALNDPSLQQRDVLEIGYSNRVISSFVNPRSHTITGNYPVADVCHMPHYQDGSFDIVILDQVLEHVQRPDR